MEDDDDHHEDRRSLYTIEEYRQRNIPKFQVLGQEYKLAINLQEKQRTYSELQQILHSVLQGKVLK